MPDDSRSDDTLKLRGPAPIETWQRLNPEQRGAAVGSLLLIISTFGPFSFVEAAVIVVAGVWCGFLILVRLVDRPLGQGLLALACAAILVAAGLRERAKRPMDDLPTEKLPERPADRA